MIRKEGEVLSHKLMTLDQLRIFLVVAKLLHFTRAAKALRLTQPAVSAAIRSLEGEYNVQLFHRIGRHVEITEAGKLLEIEAQQVLEHIALVERGLRELNYAQRGELKIGTSSTVGNYWLPEKISHFKRLYPEAYVKSVLCQPEAVWEGVALGRWDLGVVIGDDRAVLPPSLHQETIGTSKLLLVVGRSHPWFDRPQATLSELMTIAWVMQETNSRTQQQLEQMLRLWGLNPDKLNVLMVLGSSEMVKTVVEDGNGMAAIPELVIRRELQSGSLRSVSIFYRQNSRVPLEMSQPILKVKHPQRFQTQLSIAFEKILLASAHE